MFNDRQNAIQESYILLSEGLFKKKKEELPAEYTSDISKLNNQLKAKIEGNKKLIKSVEITDKNTLKILVNYKDDFDEDLWRSALRFIDSVLNSLKKLEKPVLHDTNSLYKTQFNEVKIAINFDHENNDFTIKYSFIKGE